MQMSTNQNSTINNNNNNGHDNHVPPSIFSSGIVHLSVEKFFTSSELAEFLEGNEEIDLSNYKETEINSIHTNENNRKLIFKVFQACSRKRKIISTQIDSIRRNIEKPHDSYVEDLNNNNHDVNPDTINYKSSPTPTLTTPYSSLSLSSYSVDCNESIALELKSHGNIAFGKKDYKRAIVCYSQALRFSGVNKNTHSPIINNYLIPLSCLLYTNRATCLYYLSCYSLSSVDCCYALELFDYDKPKVRLAEICSKIGKPEEAIKLIEEIETKWVEDGTTRQFQSEGEENERKSSEGKRERHSLVLRIAEVRKLNQNLGQQNISKQAEKKAKKRKEKMEVKNTWSSELNSTNSMAGPVPISKLPIPVRTGGRDVALSSYVRIATQLGSGRCLSTLRSFSAGELILSESPYAALLRRHFQPPPTFLELDLTNFPISSSYYCDYCFNPLRISHSLPIDIYIPCPHCSIAVYCSIECRRSAYVSYHSLECGELIFAAGLPDVAILTTRMIAKKIEEEEGQSEESKSENKNFYASIYSLQTHLEGPTDFSIPPSALIEYSFLAWIMEEYAQIRLRELKGREMKEKENQSDLKEHLTGTKAAAIEIKQKDILSNQIGEKRLKSWLSQMKSPLLLHHLCQTRTNIHAVIAIKQQQEDEKGNEFPDQVILKSMSSQVMSLSSKHEQAQLGKNSSSFLLTSTIRIGLGIYSFSSLINHSCQPNVHFNFFGRKISVQCNQKISSGQFLLCSYGPDVSEPVLQRRSELRSQYFFNCTCSGCEEEKFDRSRDQFKCQRTGCNGTVPSFEQILYRNLATNCGSTSREGNRLDPQLPFISALSVNPSYSPSCECSVCHFRYFNLNVFALAEEKIEKQKEEARMLIRKVEQAQQTQSNFSTNEPLLGSALAKLELAVKLGDSLYSSTNKKAAHLHDELARIYASFGFFSQSIDQLNIAIQILKFTYTSYLNASNKLIIQLGPEYFKLATLAFNQRDRLVALNAISSALSIFELYPITSPAQYRKERMTQNTEHFLQRAKKLSSIFDEEDLENFFSLASAESDDVEEEGSVQELYAMRRFLSEYPE